MNIQRLFSRKEAFMAKSILFSVLLLFLYGPVWSIGGDAGLGNMAFAATVHGANGPLYGEYQLHVVAESATIEPGEPVSLTCSLVDPHGAAVSDLEVVHEKKLHLIIVRAGLDVFTHLYPQVTADGSFSTTLVFPVAGTYFLYADVKPKGGGAVTVMTELQVQGEAPVALPLEPHVPGRILASTIGADIGLEKVSGAHRISFALCGPDGSPVTDLEPYLGAKGHLVIISEDGKQYVRIHPVDGGNATEVIFEANFPGQGLYKAWGQFQRAGQVHELPFAVRIE